MELLFSLKNKRRKPFFVRFQKYQPKEHMCVYCFLKLNHFQIKFLGGVFFKNPKRTFSGFQNDTGTYFLKVKFQICISVFFFM